MVHAPSTVNFNIQKGMVEQAPDAPAPLPSDDDDDDAECFSLNMDVFVESRTWPGINKPGGFGKVIKLNDDSTVDVR